MRKSLLLLAIMFGVRALGLPQVCPGGARANLRQVAQQTPQASPQSPQQPPSPTVPANGPVIVLDAAHGGTDTGARGENGLTEKDVVLQIAQTVRAELEREGYRVVMTRTDDSDPSYDDRAAMANGYRDAVFVSLHVSSTGQPGTVRAYFDQPDTSQAAAPGAAPTGATSAKPPGALQRWDQAQQPFTDASHRLADFIQTQLAQSFPGSPTNATPAAVRALRSVAEPCAAIEISSISMPSVESLTGSAALLAGAISRGITIFRAAVPNGAK